MEAMDFQIIKGAPTDEEIAALAVAIAQIEAESTRRQSLRSPRSRWGTPRLRQPEHSGDRGAGWHASWRRGWR